MTKKGQGSALSLVLVVAILVVVVILAYVWGRGLFDAQQTRTTVDYMTAKLFEIKSAILAVTHEGLNSSRIVQVDVPEGRLITAGGEFCSNNRMSLNVIAFNISTSSKLIDAEDWISIDPAESNTSCDAPYENSSAIVLMGKAEKIGNNYVNSYTLWFRNLTFDNGASDNHYVINITSGESSNVSGGTYRFIVRNTGTTNVTRVIYTTIKIDIL